MNTIKKRKIDIVVLTESKEEHKMKSEIKYQKQHQQPPSPPQQSSLQQQQLPQLTTILQLIKTLNINDVNIINEEIIKRKYQMMIKQNVNVVLKSEEIINDLMINSYGYRTIQHYRNPNINDNKLYEQSKAFDTEFTKKKDGDNNISCYQLNKYKNNTDNIKIYDVKNDAMTYGKYMEDPIRNQFKEAGFSLFGSSKIFSKEGYSSHPDGEFRQPLCECQQCECALEIKCTYSYSIEESPSAIYTNDNIYQMLSHLKHKRSHLCIYFHYFKLTGNHILSIVIDPNFATWNSIVYRTIIDPNQVLLNNVIPLYHYQRKYDKTTFLTQHSVWEKYFCKPYNNEQFWSLIFTSYFH